MVIDNAPTIFIELLLLHKKNGKEIIIQIARSLVFQWNPVGGLIFEYIKISPNSEKLIGSLPNSIANEEYDEIGILKLVNDSASAIIISIVIKKDNTLKIVFKSSILFEK